MAAGAERRGLVEIARKLEGARGPRAPRDPGSYASRSISDLLSLGMVNPLPALIASAFRWRRARNPSGADYGAASLVLVEPTLSQGSCLQARHRRRPGKRLLYAGDSPATRQASPAAGLTAVSMEPLGAVARRGAGCAGYEPLR